MGWPTEATLVLSMMMMQCLLARRFDFKDDFLMPSQMPLLRQQINITFTTKRGKLQGDSVFFFLRHPLSSIVLYETPPLENALRHAN